MPDIWGSIKRTAESFGGALVAPPGAVLDLATTPFDDKDDDFGSVVAKLSSRGGDILDPLTNPETFTGAAVGKAMDGANWLLDNGVNEPLSTAFIMASHLDSEDVRGTDDLRELFSGEAWSRAYEIAQEQGAGESFAFVFDDKGKGQSSPLNPSGLTLEAGRDPFALADQGIKPYDAFKADHPVAAPLFKWSANVVGAWYLDPLVLAGKGMSVLRQYQTYGKLSQSKQAGLYNLITEGAEQTSTKSRTDKWIDWVGGKNSLARPLSGPEILHGTPELRKYAAEPHVIAGLIADTNKISDPLERRDAARRILAVAAGDTSQIGRLRTEMRETASVADALTNMAKGGTLDLKLLAATPNLRHDPAFIARLEGQLANLNQRGDVDRFIDSWNARLEQILETQKTMPNLPGVHDAGKRAIKRQNDTGLLRAPANAHKAVDEWAAKRALRAESASSVFQKGRYTVPLVAVKTVGLFASPYTKAPVAATDAMRQAHFTGIANLHDWGGATTQLDSMMRLSGVSAGDRLKALSEAYLAKTEPEKMRSIERVEKMAMRAMAAKYSAKSGREINGDYIETLMMNHATRRGAALTQLRGRAYAATKMSDEMLATRGGSMQAADDAARWTQSPGFTSAPQGKWRIDQINDDGTPLALPLLDTQLANSVPLLDMGLADKLLKRDTGRLARLSKAWEDESLELKRLSGLKAAGAKGLDKAIQRQADALDWLVDAGQKTMRVWKFSVLFRLGYPMRVLMDDHWRIWTQMSAASLYGGSMGELGQNLKYNAWDRRVAARNAVHRLRIERQQILDELDSDLMAVHGDRHADLKRLRREAGAIKGQITKGGESDGLRERLADKEAAIANLLEDLGDEGPEQLRRRLATIEEEIKAGTKAHRAEKRTIGSADLDLGNGQSIPGAFGGLRGAASREATKSSDTFEIQLRGVEDRMFQSGMRGAHRTIDPSEPGHLDAWADALNYQIRQSPVAMHFLKGGDLDSFVSWIKKPEQAQLRQRLSHFAHDPEDWGGRVQALVDDYVPSEALREAIVDGRVSARQLGKMFTDQSLRPSVHGRSLADNLGTSGRALGVSKALNSVYRMLGEMPTDHLSRHPFFNAMYKQHARDAYEVKRIGFATEGKTTFGPEDLADIERTARKRALHDLKRTLFDISAHSHAAHAMRFVSPFFAAHQESLARWWRIVGDDPSVVRRFALAFDLPRHLGIVIDENGEKVEPGDAISVNHRILLQLPKEWGGPDADESWSKWSISENSFNLILQGGLANPGVGPIVAVPVEYLARRYANETEIARVARVFNPYPPQSPMEAALPATFKRLSAYTYGKTGVDPSLGLGIGQREYNDAYAQYIQDEMVSFRLEYGREPNKQESETIMQRAGREATSQMFHRFLWNSVSPAPAQPRSKYALIQQGWYRISEQARSEGRDFEWAYTQFREKFGDAYMPLVSSTANNPASVDATAGTVAALRRYRGVLDRIDPALSRIVIGAYAEDLAEENVALGEYSQEARAFLRQETMQPGSPETYYSYDDPRTALEEQMARRGWQKYGELTGALTAQAESMGLSSYNESDQLVALKRAGVERLRAENWAFDKDYGSFDQTQYDRYLDDMRVIVKSPALAGDVERTDIQVLSAYLKLRDYFVSLLEAREAQGLGGVDAAANEPVRAIYTALVGRLVESNTYFENYVYNGTVERDPLLVGE